MIDLRIKKLFFDTKAVRQAVDRGRRKALSRAGAFVRTRARSSIRKRKKPSQPGQPPSSHTGILKRFILFGYDPQRDSVIVGPAETSNASGAPKALEYGGTAALVSRRKGRSRIVRIAARPFMQPALEAEQATIAAAFRNCVGPK